MDERPLLQISITLTYPGRHFYGCQRENGHHYDYVAWVDPELSEHYIMYVNGLNKTVQELTEERNEALIQAGDVDYKIEQLAEEFKAQLELKEKELKEENAFHNEWILKKEEKNEICHKEIAFLKNKLNGIENKVCKDCKKLCFRKPRIDLERPLNCDEDDIHI